MELNAFRVCSIVNNDFGGDGNFLCLVYFCNKEQAIRLRMNETELLSRMDVLESENQMSDCKENRVGSFY